MYALVMALSLTSFTQVQAATNSLTVSSTETEIELILRAALPSDLLIKEDFQITWDYIIKYVTAQGYIGTFSTQQQVKSIDLKNAEFNFYLPLNGKYLITLQAEVKNGKNTTKFEYSKEIFINKKSGFNITEIPDDVIPSLSYSNRANGNEIIQLKVGSDAYKSGNNFSNGYRLGDYVRLVNFRQGRIETETLYNVCEMRKLECINDSTPGFSIINLKKSFYTSHRIYFSSGWTILISRPDWDSRVFVYSFQNKEEVKIEDWESSRSSAPDAVGATAGLKCPDSFKGSVLSCSITPVNKSKNIKMGPIWVEVKIFADNVEQKKLTKTIKTRIGQKSLLKFQLPSSYKELDIRATTLGIEGASQEKSWESAEPLTAMDKQRSYNLGYNSILSSSQSDLNSVNFYSSVTGADGRVIRSKAQVWCQSIIFNQVTRGVQIKSSQDWVRGCTDAAMRL